MSGLIKAFMRPKQPARPSSAQTLVTTPSTSPDQHDLEAGETHTGEVGEVEVRKLEQENHLLQQQLRKAEQKYAALKKQVAELEKDLRKECSDKNASREEAKTFYSKVLSLKKENASLNRELKECQGRLDSSIVDLRKAQLSSFKQSQTGWFVEEDSRIHESLAQFYKDVRLWAKTYCLKSLETFCDVDDHTRSYLSNAVLGVASFQEWDDFCKFKHPFLILAALVSETLRSWMFGDYFYIFVRPGDPSDNGATRMALLETFNKLLTGNVVGAHTWRALLFRGIFPSPESPELRTGPGFSTRNCGDLLESIMGALKYGPACAFVRSMEENEDKKCTSELQNLVQRAMKLFSRLQTQRAYYTWHTPSQLLRTGFDVHSPELAADRLVRLEDDEDESHNGKKIKLVVSPMVQKHGDSNGENFHTTTRVITKAVVFLEG
ncbi:hypothetical protein DBV05_g124 [Lasiodiplodia theobromae]|uniref:Uncharacterized protein n=1 Tax=Lasiodiplodia theobromae TaxID=45133 RepID=A0A5N5DV06_9PEZI|nr:hypothetical protein DBV05_g124 [Lasiodiplodia theobromae]